MVINGKFPIGEEVVKIGDTPMPGHALPTGKVFSVEKHPITGYEIYQIEWHNFNTPRYSFERGTDILPLNKAPTQNANTPLAPEEC